MLAVSLRGDLYLLYKKPQEMNYTQFYLDMEIRSQPHKINRGGGGGMAARQRCSGTSASAESLTDSDDNR